MAKNATVDMVGEIMLGLFGWEGRLYLNFYFKCCQLTTTCDPHIWKVARVTTTLKITINSLGIDCLFTCHCLEDRDRGIQNKEIEVR